MYRGGFATTLSDCDTKGRRATGVPDQAGAPTPHPLGYFGPKFDNKTKLTHDSIMTTKTLNSHAPGSRHHKHLAPLMGESGVYYLTDGTGRAYVGSTRDLGSRLRGHSRKYAGWMYGYRRLPLAEARKAEVFMVRTLRAKGHNVINHNTPRAQKLLHPQVSRQLYHRRLKLGWSEREASMTPPRGYAR